MGGVAKREFLRWLGAGAALGPALGAAADCYAAATPGGPDAPPAGHGPLFFGRDDAAYAALNQGYNKRLHFLPRYIAACADAADVQRALALARRQGLAVAVRSGGHSFEGFSSNDDGLVVNVARLKRVRWLDAETVEIGAGCTLQEVQAALFPRGRLLPAGSCGSVGIAGLTLGGGYGFFSRAHGLTCDSLLGLSLVAPDGRLVDTDEDAELLWACKGGGNGNFGVVTALRFRTQPMPARFAACVLKFRGLDAARYGRVLQAWFEVADALPVDAFAACVLNGRTVTVLLAGHGVDLQHAARPLAPLAASVAPTLGTPLPQAMRRYYGRPGPIDFKNASAGLYRGAQDLAPLQEALFEQVVAHPGLVFQVNTLGGRIADPAFEQASCYPHRHLPYLGELQAYWDGTTQPQAGPRLMAAFESIQALFRAHGVTAHYRNYPDLNFRDWEHAYYGANYARLQAVKRRYDAGGLLRYPQGVRPA